MASNVLTTVGKVLLANTIDGVGNWVRLSGSATTTTSQTIAWVSTNYVGIDGYQGLDFDIDASGNMTLNNTPVVEFDIAFVNYNPGSGTVGLNEVRITTVELYGSSNSLPDTNKFILNATLDNSPIIFEGPGKFTLTDFQITIS